MFLSCFYTPWPCTAALKATAGWKPRCYLAPVQRWNAFDHRMLWSFRGILFDETQPCEVPDQLSWEHLTLATDLNTFMSCFMSTCKEHAENSVHVVSSVSPLLQCQVRHFSQMYQSLTLPNNAPVRLNMQDAASKCLMSQIQGCFPQVMWRSTL